MVESTFLNQRAILVAEWGCCVREVSHALTVSHPKTSIVRKYARLPRKHCAARMLCTVPEGVRSW